MAACKTSLQLVAFNADSTDLLAILEDVSVTGTAKVEDGRPITQAYEFSQAVKQGSKIAAKVMQDGTGQRTTNLDISVFTIGGTDYLGTLASGSVRVTNETRDGSGIADYFEFPCAVASKIEMRATLHIPSASLIHALLTIGHASTLANKAVTVAITIGGVAISAPMLLSVVDHKASRGELQTVEVTLVGRGTPTSPAAGTIYGTAITGTAAATLWLDTKAGQYGLTGAKIPTIIEECSFEFSSGAIVRNNFVFAVQGNATYSTSA